MDLFQKVRAARDYILERTGRKANIGAILGSGLGALADMAENPVVLDYEKIPYFPTSTVKGHQGCLVTGRVGENTVMFLQGRFHYYEGYSMDEVTFPVRVMQETGVNTLLVTNAAGGVNPDFLAGDLMIINDHINLMGINPLLGPNVEEWGPRFPDMSEAYHPELRKLLRETGNKMKIELREGVYSGLTGPSYETPAEIRYLRAIGADAVGMSTVPEVIVANHAGMKVLGLSCITNQAAGTTGQKLSHEEVVAVGRAAQDKMITLLGKVLAKVKTDAGL